MVTIGAGVALAVLLSRLFRAPNHGNVSADWLNRFSLERYRVMERLLSKADLSFLESQKGYSPSIGRRLKEERCRIFRLYLHQLKRDFRRLEGVVLLFLAAAEQDRPELAKALLQRRVVFQWAVLVVEWRLFLFRHGLGNAVEAGNLVGALSGLRVELGQIALARQPAAA